ncbi:hypothetical protein LEP3755_38800 [Leptolyngbya sp. NIES-3755]|nr:hypothetical protein LEP3755_38800 [Leptolyngbya sp. NIES-3755]
MIDEPIHLEQHRLEWEQDFIQEQKRIQVALQIDSSTIQHIGSTAISEICAKPIIDIMIGVVSFPPSQSLLEQMIKLDYEALGEAGVLDRLYFRYRKLQSFNAHIVEHNGTHWRSNLALRDYLRSHPEEAKRYEAAKIEAVCSGALSLLEYSAAKSALIEELMLRALAWQSIISEDD